LFLEETKLKKWKFKIILISNDLGILKKKKKKKTTNEE
jgi:hypothetical protein